MVITKNLMEEGKNREKTRLRKYKKISLLNPGCQTRMQFKSIKIWLIPKEKAKNMQFVPIPLGEVIPLKALFY